MDLTQSFCCHYLGYLFVTFAFFFFFPHLSRKLIYESFGSLGENSSLMLADNVFNIQI